MLFFLRSSTETLSQKNVLNYDGEIRFFKRKGTSFSTLVLEHFLSRCQRHQNWRMSLKAYFVVKKPFLKIRFLTNFTTFRMFYYVTLGLTVTFVIGIN
jgi:hypothetical protein